MACRRVESWGRFCRLIPPPPEKTGGCAIVIELDGQRPQIGQGEHLTGTAAGEVAHGILPRFHQGSYFFIRMLSEGHELGILR